MLVLSAYNIFLSFDRLIRGSGEIVEEMASKERSLFMQDYFLRVN
jgi:hypothetical protein